MNDPRRQPPVREVGYVAVRPLQQQRIGAPGNSDTVQGSGIYVEEHAYMITCLQFILLAIILFPLFY